MNLEELARLKAVAVIDINRDAQLTSDNGEVYLPKALNLLLFVDNYNGKRLEVTTVQGEHFYINKEDVLDYKIVGNFKFVK